ncbi:hypothetical protein F5Y19DRAFT_467995 [Xylariaceae sp. FL1651]|nr:hypothetical protein F5Y19DRAFT_467995 [Xylariaceae sp. FL1651]
MSFTLTPFLYQTRTILRIPPLRASALMVRSLHTTCQRPKGSADIPFDYEVKSADEDTRVESASSRGTITPSERQIFERIFADIRARGLKPATHDDAPQPGPTVARSAMLIMQQAAYDAGQARSSTVTHPALLSGATKDRAKALLRFPPELRGAASKALNTIQLQANGTKSYDDVEFDSSAAAAEEGDFIDDWKAPAHTSDRAAELESERYPERIRIEGLITSAQSDFDLWDILEREVFTMPARLEAVNGERTASTDATKPEDASATSNGLADPTDYQKLNLYVHGPLYPAYLLLALRRLDTAFHAPSPLALSILPRIKELGLESYVLGISTPFFNELLEIYWTRRGDLSSMIDILEEMRHCGLYFDSQTASILKRVDEVIFGLASAKGRSAFGRALMQMPEYELSQRGRIREWYRAVDLSLQQRQDDFAFASSADVRQ